MKFGWNEETLHYVDEGSGDPLVLLHGLGGNAENWLLQRREFAKTHRVLCVDLPGHGSSSGRRVVFADYGRAIEAVLDHAGVEAATLCGLSKGARAGLALASRKPERVSGIVIVNAFLHLEPEDRARRLQLYDLLLEQGGAKLWAEKLLELMGVADHPAIVRGFLRSIEHIDPHHIRRVFREQQDWGQRSELGRLSCPVLVVRGRKDGFVPAYCADEIMTGVSYGELVQLDAGHLPYLEMPAAFNSVVFSFLTRSHL